MRILQLMGTLDRGGVESMIANLIRNGLKTDICLEIPDKGMLEEELETYGCHIYHLTRRSDSMKKHHQELAEIVKNYDAVHIHAQNAFLAYIEVRTIKKAGVKHVIVHSHNTKDWRSGMLGSVLHVASRPLLRRSCVTAACSTEAARWMFGTRKVLLLPLPIDTEKFRHKKEAGEEQREKLNIEKDKAVLLHIGNFRKAKNHIFLIRLIRSLENLYPGRFLLLLAGNGPLRKQMEKEAEGLPVRFLGSIEDVPQTMAASSLFLLPSLNEGLPTVALEAQAAGLPCLLSDRITMECKVTNLVYFLPLDIQIWLDWIPSVLAAGVKKPEQYADIVKKSNGTEAVLEKFRELYRNMT